MRIGYVGDGLFATAAIQRLLATHQVTTFTPESDEAVNHGGAAAASTLAQLARDADVIVVSLPTHSALRGVLFGSEGLAQGLSAGKIVVDQTPGLPDDARALAQELRNDGVVLLDAPIHSERSDPSPELSVMTCGGSVDAFESIRPVLALLCPNLVHCGESGSGRAAHLVVAAVAACNRLITYECATVGVKNGLAFEHMAAVINKSSGANSAWARVLPVLGERGHSADLTLGTALEELKLASRLAMQCGAPLLFANLATAMFQSAASQFGATGTVDEIARMFEASAAIDFTDPSTWVSARLA